MSLSLAIRCTDFDEDLMLAHFRFGGRGVVGALYPQKNFLGGTASQQQTTGRWRRRTNNFLSAVKIGATCELGFV